MSKEQLKAFIEKVKGDTSLQEKLNAAASPEAAVEIAKEAAFAITTEDIQTSSTELSDEELEGAATQVRSHQVEQYSKHRLMLLLLGLR